MSTPLVVLGDDIPVLRGLSPAAPAGEQTQVARGVVWGVNLAGLTPRAARARLKASATDALRAAKNHTGASHLTVVFTHDAPHRTGTRRTGPPPRRPRRGSTHGSSWHEGGSGTSS